MSVVVINNNNIIIICIAAASWCKDADEKISIAWVSEFQMTFEGMSS